MHHVTAPITCVTCELEILGSPTIHQGLPFCCAGCAAGGPCTCSYDPEASDDPRVRRNHDATAIHVDRAVAHDPHRLG